jgi:hypothetical protein
VPPAVKTFRLREVPQSLPANPQRSPRVVRLNTVGFYLVPEFPMMAFASAIEPLRAAKRLTGERRFDWKLVSHDGNAVRASNGIDVAVHRSINDEVVLDMLLVLCRNARRGRRWTQPYSNGCAVSRAMVHRSAASASAHYVLALCRTARWSRCALHWESVAAFQERFPRIRTTDRHFCHRWQSLYLLRGTAGARHDASGHLPNATAAPSPTMCRSSSSIRESATPSDPHANGDPEPARRRQTKS